jgi:serine/threonine protein kinase
LGDLQFPDEEWENISEQAKDFITKCLEHDHEKRPHVWDLCVHPWLGLEKPVVISLEEVTVTFL